LDIQSKWDGNTEVPVDPKAVVTKSLSAEDARKRFEVEINKGNLTTHKQRLAYTMVGEVEEQVMEQSVEPMHLFLNSPRYKIQGGKDAHGFMEWVGFKVGDPTAKPVFFLKAKKNTSATPPDIK